MAKHSTTRLSHRGAIVQLPVVESGSTDPMRFEAVPEVQGWSVGIE